MRRNCIVNDQRAPLRFPELVRLVARPADLVPARVRQLIAPEWLIRAVRQLRGGWVPGPLAHAGIAATEPLDVLVVAPPGTADLTVGYVIGEERFRCPCSWQPVVWVSPERHDPSRGRYSPERYPTIRFEDTTHDQDQRRDGPAGAPADDAVQPGHLREQPAGQRGGRDELGAG